MLVRDREQHLLLQRVGSVVCTSDIGGIAVTDAMPVEAAREALSAVATEVIEQATHGEHELRWRDLVHALPAAIYTTDAAGRITYYNEAAAALWGCEPEIGKSEWCGSWKLFWPDGTPCRTANARWR